MRIERNGWLWGVLIAFAQACAQSRAPNDDAGAAAISHPQGGSAANAGRGEAGGGAGHAAGALAAGGGGASSLVGGSGGMAADADSGTPDYAELLCDGSDAMRLMFTSGGGFVPDTYFFSFPYGSYFAIDGHCRFFAQGGAEATFTGTLSSADEAKLSADVAWSKLDDWGNYTGDQECPDAGTVILGKASAALGCSCGCDMSAPSGLAQAQTNANDWLTKLTMSGSPLTGAMSAVARPDAGGNGTQPPIPWPLSRSMASIPNLVVGSGSGIGTGPFARFDDAADTAALRKLHGSSSPFSGIPVSEGGKTYDLFVRDELPDDAAAAIMKLQQTWPKSWQ